jgi:hypothetical protein
MEVGSSVRVLNDHWPRGRTCCLCAIWSTFRMPLSEESLAKLFMYLAVGVVWTIIAILIVAHLFGHRSI